MGAKSSLSLSEQQGVYQRDEHQKTGRAMGCTGLF